MRSVLRSVGAVLAGFVGASLVMMLVEFLNGHVFFPGLAKAAEGIKDREAMRALMGTVPKAALLVVIVGWILGAIAGGWVTAKLSQPASRRGVFILCALLILAGISNNLMMPPPLWFWVASLMVFLPATLLGERLAAR